MNILISLILEKKNRRMVASKNQMLATMAGLDAKMISMALLKREIDTPRYPKMVFFRLSFCSHVADVIVTSSTFIIAYPSPK